MGNKQQGLATHRTDALSRGLASDPFSQPCCNCCRMDCCETGEPCACCCCCCNMCSNVLASSNTIIFVISVSTLLMVLTVLAMVAALGFYPFDAAPNGLI